MVLQALPRRPGPLDLAHAGVDRGRADFGLCGSRADEMILRDIGDLREQRANVGAVRRAGGHMHIRHRCLLPLSPETAGVQVDL